MARPLGVRSALKSKETVKPADTVAVYLYAGWRTRRFEMAVVVAMMICLAVAVPFVAFAWAMKRRHCPNCGAEIEPDPELLRMFTGR